MIKYILLLFSLLALLVQSQQITVLDADTNKPIPMASITFRKDGKVVKHTFADDNGYAAIDKAANFDVMTVSSIGYADKEVQKEDLQDGKIYLGKVSYKLKEIYISNKADTLLGELSARSKKYSTLAPGSKVACYFENVFKSQGTKLKSAFFKVSGAKYRTAVTIHIYKRHNYVQDAYHPETLVKHSYDSFIPGEDITEPIPFIIEPGTKGVVEVDLSAYGIEMPKEGVFISVECEGYFDKAGKPVQVTKGKDFTWLEFHKSNEDNFCQWIGHDKNHFWLNINKWRRSDYENVLQSTPPKKAFQAPNFGLKVSMPEAKVLDKSSL